MEILAAHWHHIVPVVIILIAVCILQGRDKK